MFYYFKCPLDRISCCDIGYDISAFFSKINKVKVEDFILPLRYGDENAKSQAVNTMDLATGDE